MWGLDQVDIRIEVFSEQEEAIEAAHEKVLAENKMRHSVGLEFGREHVHEYNGVCCTKRRLNVGVNPKIRRNTRVRGSAPPVIYNRNKYSQEGTHKRHEEKQKCSYLLRMRR